MYAAVNRIARLALIAGTVSAGGALMGLASSGEREQDRHARADAPTIVEIAAGNEDFSTLVSAVKAAGLVETLNSEGPFTVFAPTNDAFAGLDQRALANTLRDTERLTQLLTFHVVPGRITAEQLATTRFLETVNGNRVEIGRNGGLGVEQASIVAADIEAGNGIIHVINDVLIPTKLDIVETASSAGSFETLIAAARAAGLAGSLKSDGPLTVFAPTDEAFAALGADTIETLLRPENKQTLATVLRYHVVSGRTYSGALLGGAEIKTLSGETVEASFGPSGLSLNDKSRVTTADLGATNGVIHVIDSVLIPPSLAEALGALNNPLRATDDAVVATIAGAIDLGAPLFNEGDTGRCAAVYRAAALSLVNYDAFGLEDSERTLLEGALDRAGHQPDRDAAWTLRRAFDRILRDRVGATAEAERTARRGDH
ncbi:MAG: fasciclin domain-containing protein [Phycisphaerales bacterium JB040]